MKLEGGQSNGIRENKLGDGVESCVHQGNAVFVPGCQDLVNIETEFK